jgi:hypothetical protein
MHIVAPDAVGLFFTTAERVADAASHVSLVGLGDPPLPEKLS